MSNICYSGSVYGWLFHLDQLDSKSHLAIILLLRENGLKVRREKNPF